MALSLVLLTAGSVEAGEADTFQDENGGFSWKKVTADDGSSTNVLMDQEMPPKRMILSYRDMYKDVDLSRERLKKMLFNDMLAVDKRDSATFDKEFAVRFETAPKTEAFLKEYLYSCLDRVEEDVPRVEVTFKLAYRPQWPASKLTLEARQSGLIMIDPKVLQKAENYPSALLFFIAHEYGHVVMQHDTDPVKALEQKMATAAGPLSTVGTSMFSGLKSFGNAVSKLAGDETGFEARMQNSAIRFQEDHADMFGADLMRACGYAAEDILEAFDVVAAWQGKGPSFYTARQTMENLNQNIQLSEENAGNNDGQDAAKSFASFFSFGGEKKSDKPDEARSGFGGAMLDSVDALEEETKRQHRSAVSRGQFMSNYFAAFYSDDDDEISFDEEDKPEAALFSKFAKYRETRKILDTDWSKKK